MPKESTTPETPQTNATETPASAPAHAPGRGPSKHFPGVAQRDVELVGRLASDYSELFRALSRGDADAIRAIYPRLLKSPREAERIRFVARRAMSRGA